MLQLFMTERQKIAKVLVKSYNSNRFHHPEKTSASTVDDL